MQLRTQRFLSSTSPLPEADHDIWLPTAPSLGSRTPQLRSRFSSTGFIVEEGRVINFESRPERFAAEAFAMDPTIELVIEQPPRVEYLDSASTIRHHTFDIFTATVDATRSLVAIKHSSRVKSSGIWSLVKLIASQIDRSVADQITVMTELDFSKSARFNAELAHEIKRFPIPANDQHIRAITDDIQGIVTIQDIVKLSGLRAEGFRSIVRLIASRFFILADYEARIDCGARIRRNPTPPSHS